METVRDQLYTILKNGIDYDGLKLFVEKMDLPDSNFTLRYGDLELFIIPNYFRVRTATTMPMLDGSFVITVSEKIPKEFKRHMIFHEIIESDLISKCKNMRVYCDRGIRHDIATEFDRKYAKEKLAPESFTEYEKSREDNTTPSAQIL